MHHHRKCFQNGPEQDLNLGPCRMAVIEDCLATTLTSEPPWLDGFKKSLLTVTYGLECGFALVGFDDKKQEICKIVLKL